MLANVMVHSLPYPVQVMLNKSQNYRCFSKVQDEDKNSKLKQSNFDSFRYFTKYWFGFVIDFPLLKRNVSIIFILFLLIIGFYSALPFRFAAVWHSYVPAEKIIGNLHAQSHNIEKNEFIDENHKFCQVPQIESDGRLTEIDELQLLHNKSISHASLSDLHRKYNIENGGEWRPKSCKTLFKVAIVIPYRNRKHHREIFLSYIHPFLQNQNVHYRIFIIEQSRLYKFNRGKILNIGFTEINKKWEYDCFIFHDIDLLPEKIQNIYACSNFPRHASSAVNSLRYNLPYRNMFGGVTAILKFHFMMVNGFSNLYYGWGGEDDELHERLQDKGLDVIRWDPRVARYSMIFHPKSKSVGENRYQLLGSYRSRQQTDGLTTLHYNLIKIEERSLYTWIFADINDS